MPTVNFSVPDDVKRAFNAAFDGQNKSAVIAELMREAVARVEQRRVHEAAVTRILAGSADREPVTEALAGAVDLAARLDHPVLDTLYHALALATPGAVLVTADRRCFDKACALGQIRWLQDFRSG
jgi:predicted nucleic acid-binding protein